MEAGKVQDNNHEGAAMRLNDWLGKWEQVSLLRAGLTRDRWN